MGSPGSPFYPIFCRVLFFMFLGVSNRFEAFQSLPQLIVCPRDRSLRDCYVDTQFVHNDLCMIHYSLKHGNFVLDDFRQLMALTILCFVMSAGFLPLLLMAVFSWTELLAQSLHSLFILLEYVFQACKIVAAHNGVLPRRRGRYQAFRNYSCFRTGTNR